MIADVKYVQQSLPPEDNHSRNGKDYPFYRTDSCVFCKMSHCIKNVRRADVDDWVSDTKLVPYLFKSR